MRCLSRSSHHDSAMRRPGLKVPNAFSDGCFGIGEVSKTKVAHNRVKRRVGERQVFDVRNMKLVTWIRGFCELDHPGREVDPSIPYAERVFLAARTPGPEATSRRFMPGRTRATSRRDRTASAVTGTRSRDRSSPNGRAVAVQKHGSDQHPRSITTYSRWSSLAPAAARTLAQWEMAQQSLS